MLEKILEMVASNPQLITFYILGQVVLVLCWIACLVALYRKGNAKIALGGVIAIGIMAVVLAILPLERSYSMYPGSDRMLYLAHAMGIAEGNPILEDFALSGVPTAHSPVFATLVAVIHWVTTISVSLLYNYGPLITVIFLPLSLYLYSKTLVEKVNWGWLGALMAFCVMFLAQDPLDLRFHEMGFWDQVVLYKPEHGLAFICLPLLYYFISRRPLSRKAYFLNLIVCGLFLALMISASLVVGGFVICGLVLYPLIVYLLRRQEAGAEAKRVFPIIALGFLFSSWYWLRPFFYSPMAPSGDGLGLPLVYPSNIPVVFDPFEATFFMMPLFWLGVVGIIALLHKRQLSGLLLVSFIVAMYLGKVIAPFSWMLFNFAPQAWELSLWGIRVGMGMAAGVGLFTIAKFLESRHEGILKGIRRFSLRPVARFLGWLFGRQASTTPSKRLAVWVCLLLLLLTPYMTPMWCLPVLNPRVLAALEPIPAEIQNYAAWIRENTQHDSIFLCDGDTSNWVGALTGRKMMVDRDGLNPFGNFAVRKEDATTIYNSDSIEEIKPILEHYNVSYIVVNHDTIVEYPQIAQDKFYNESYFEIVYQEDSTTIFEFKAH